MLKTVTPDAPDKSPQSGLVLNLDGVMIRDSWFFRDGGMKTIHDPGQKRLFDPFDGVIGRTGWKQIENGWQSLFRDVLLERCPSVVSPRA